VVSFWIMAVIIFGIVMGLGAPTAISDADTAGIANSKVQIVAVSQNSSAEQAGLRIGDNILEIKNPTSEFQKIDKIANLQDFINLHQGEELTLKIERGKEIFTVSALSRANPPAGEGSLGIALQRIAIKSYPWWQAPWQGILITFNLTKDIIFGYVQLIAKVFQGLPTGVEFMGPVGIVRQGANIVGLGWNYFLLFIGQIAVYVAIFNILPIPALDGGKLLFLLIELQI